MAVSFRFSSDSSVGDPALETLNDVVQQMAQGMVRVQEAMRQQFQEAQRQLEQRLQETFHQQMQEIQLQAERRLQEALHEQEQKLQADFRQQLHEALRQQEQRLLGIEKKVGAAEHQYAPYGVAGGEEHRENLEARMDKLEASVERALEDVFPRVDALLVQLEKSPTPQPPFLTSATPPPAVLLEEEQQPVSVDELEKAVKAGREHDVKRLLDAGADVNVRVNREWTLLMLAAKEAHPDVVSLLLNRHADVHATTWDGRTALHFAAYNDRSGRCVSLLISFGANVNSRRLFGATPLNDAVTARNETAVRALLEAGATKSARSNYSRSPLDYAKIRAFRRLFQF